MLGEPKNQFSLTRSAQYRRRAKAISYQFSEQLPEVDRKAPAFFLKHL
jgi:hypothetical protein